jgi:hypothetical protein
MKVRRLRTGRTAEGKSVYVGDEPVDGLIPPLLGGNEIVRLWGWDAPIQLPTDGALPDFWHNYYPPSAGALRFILWRMPPSDAAGPEITDADDAARITEEMAPHMFDVIAHREDVHATDTVDLVYIVSGRCDLELDDADKRTLGPGDVLVQNNTTHAWSNPYDEDCLIVIIQCGAVAAER